MKRTNRRRLLTGVLAAIFLLVLSACGTEDEPAQGTLRDVTVILDYTVNTNHTGLYNALDLGYYEEVGLNVSIIEPADGATPNLIAAGTGEFGVTYQEDLTYALAQEQPLPIKAIATVIQHNTSGFSVLADSGISSPADFEGKTYAGWGSAAEEAILKAVIKASGADPEQFNFVVSDGVGYHGLGGDYDIIWTYEAWDRIAAEEDGVLLHNIELRDLDPRLDYYTPILVTNNDLIENDPELVRNFLAATARGYQYAIDKPVESAGILHQYAPTYTLEMLTKSQQILSPRYSEGVEQWGVMREEVWRGYTDFMLEYALIEQDVPAADCFTNEFLPTP